MTILLSFQTFHNISLYDEIVGFSKLKNIHKIYITSSLMHELDIEVVNKYKKIEKVIFIESNTLFSSKQFSNKKFTLSNKDMTTDSNIITNLLSSYRWLPISKRNENDQMSFAMTLHYDVYNFWNSFFHNSTIDAVILLNDEHSSLDSLLIECAKKNRVKNILTCSNAGALAAQHEEYFAFFDSANSEYVNLEIFKEQNYQTTSLNTENIDFTTFSDEYKVRKIQKMMYYTNRLTRIIHSNQNILQKTTELWKKTINLMKMKLLLFFQLNYIKKLEVYYEKISCQEIDFQKKYIYYCLHFDPEANTLPKDMIHANQLLNIRILSSAIPSDWIIYVKEHPHQLQYKLYKELFQNQLHSINNFRSEKFYNYINSLKNVKLVSLKSAHKKLILNAQYIASNNGTVFREASYLGKSCLSFSKKSIYTLLDNIYYISDGDSAKNIIINNLNKAQADRCDVDELFYKYSITIKDIHIRDAKLLSFIISTRIFSLNNDK